MYGFVLSLKKSYKAEFSEATIKILHLFFSSLESRFSSKLQLRSYRILRSDREALGS